MLVSPAEPPELRALGATSPVPERYGADFVIYSKIFGVVGVQRKELSDLVASLHDGRLAKEIAQSKAIDQPVLIIEGTPQWTEEGALLSTRRSTYTREAHLGLWCSLQSQGWWVLPTSSMEETIWLLSTFDQWLQKDRHTALLSRGKTVKAAWGKADNRDWAIHVMEGFPMLGYERAKAIVDHFGGLPLALRNGADLRAVKGVGKGIAGQVERLLDGAS